MHPALAGCPPRNAGTGCEASSKPASHPSSGSMIRCNSDAPPVRSGKRPFPRCEPDSIAGQQHPTKELAIVVAQQSCIPGTRCLHQFAARQPGRGLHVQILAHFPHEPVNRAIESSRGPSARTLPCWADEQSTPKDMTGVCVDHHNRAGRIAAARSCQAKADRRHPATGCTGHDSAGTTCFSWPQRPR